MWKNIVGFLQRRNVSKTELCLWLFFTVHLFGIWIFQHYMIEATWADRGVTPVTVVCLFLILFLMPYSLSHKLRIKPQWYSLIFLPEIILCTLLSQESLSLSCVIAAAVAIGIFVLLVYKQPMMPGKPVTTNIVLYLGMAVYYCVFANTDELTHYKYTIMHYERVGQYDRALETGKKSLHINNEVFCLRAIAMLKTNTIGNRLFKYPVPCDFDTIRTISGLDTSQRRDAILCNLLLQKKLDIFVGQLQNWYDIKSPDLPRYYKEALVIYLSKTIDTDLTYDDTAVQTDYNDFVAEMKKHSDRQVRSNMCRWQYPDSYFWYYFFFQRQE